MHKIEIPVLEFSWFFGDDKGRGVNESIRAEKSFGCFEMT